MTEEASRTVRKDKEGKYFDISKDALPRKGIVTLTDEELMTIFYKTRVRYSLTPQCNLWCSFCSNEGSLYSAKKDKYANIDLITKLSEMLLESTPLRQIDFSGGEPTLHPDFIKKEYKLIQWTKKYPEVKFSIHTNGIELNPDIIDELKVSFSRIGISINSMNFETWNKITNSKNYFQRDSQKKKFEKLLDNIEYLGHQDIGEKVFLKAVIMRGFNDSYEELDAILKTADKYKFHPKFLEFDPQYESQLGLKVPRIELFKKLEDLGCEIGDVPRDSSQKCYYPNVNFLYKSEKNSVVGLHSIFGCGLEGACLSCYDYLCMFVKPTSDGEGLYLKPCSVLDTRFDLTHAINQEDNFQLLNLFKMSREYLMLAPGLGTIGWNKEKKFETK